MHSNNQTDKLPGRGLRQQALSKQICNGCAISSNKKFRSTEDICASSSQLDFVANTFFFSSKCLNRYQLVLNQVPEDSESFGKALMDIIERTQQWRRRDCFFIIAIKGMMGIGSNLILVFWHLCSSCLPLLSQSSDGMCNKPKWGAA